MNHSLQSGLSGNTANGFSGALPLTCSKYLNNKWIAANPGTQKTTVPSTDTVLTGTTVSTLLIQAGDCMYDFGEVLAAANTGNFATAIGATASAKTAFNGALTYSDGWALVTSINLPLTAIPTTCPTAGFNLGLCYTQGTNN
jgi:hypothetical protein